MWIHWKPLSIEMNGERELQESSCSSYIHFNGDYKFLLDSAQYVLWMFFQILERITQGGEQSEEKRES